MRPLTALITALAALAVQACGDASVQWTDPVELRAPAATSTLVVDDSGRASLVADTVTASLPAAFGACPSSARFAAGTTRFYAVWWRVRADSSIALYTASSRDRGRTWADSAIVDTTKVDIRGCDRPAPSATTVGDDLYLAYSMMASEGTGVFFAHFMSSMLHSPVAVIYGERLVATAIATRGDRVAVAYEEPNGSRQQVDVALSATQGHIFERHEIASREVDAAASPLVALSDHYVAVAWRARASSDTSNVLVVRVGRLP
jgi:hypothetical protein